MLRRELEARPCGGFSGRDLAAERATALWRSTWARCAGRQAPKGRVPERLDRHWGRDDLRIWGGDSRSPGNLTSGRSDHPAQPAPVPAHAALCGCPGLYAGAYTHSQRFAGVRGEAVPGSPGLRLPQRRTRLGWGRLTWRGKVHSPSGGPSSGCAV